MINLRTKISECSSHKCEVFIIKCFNMRCVLMIRMYFLPTEAQYFAKQLMTALVSEHTSRARTSEFTWPMTNDQKKICLQSEAALLTDYSYLLSLI